MERNGNFRHLHATLLSSWEWIAVVGCFTHIAIVTFCLLWFKFCFLWLDTAHTHKFQNLINVNLMMCDTKHHEIQKLSLLFAGIALGILFSPSHHPLFLFVLTWTADYMKYLSTSLPKSTLHFTSFIASVLCGNSRLGYNACPNVKNVNLFMLQV